MKVQPQAMICTVQNKGLAEALESVTHKQTLQMGFLCCCLWLLEANKKLIMPPDCTASHTTTTALLTLTDIVTRTTICEFQLKYSPIERGDSEWDWSRIREMTV